MGSVTHLDDHVAASPRSISALSPSFPRSLPLLKGRGRWKLGRWDARARWRVDGVDNGFPSVYRTCGPEARVPRWQRSPRWRAASTCGPEDRVPRWHRSPRRRAASTCGPEARVPWWQRGSSVADACGSSLSRHPRTVPQSKNLSHRPGNVDDQDGFMVR